jgi:hypothetical protein
MSDLDSFTATYRRHVAAVQAGDTAAALADMDPAVVPHVLAGVRVPRSRVLSHEVLSIALDGGIATGTCMYETEDGPIGLRSTWRPDGDRWVAYALENVP